MVFNYYFFFLFSFTHGKNKPKMFCFINFLSTPINFIFLTYNFQREKLSSKYDGTRVLGMSAFARNKLKFSDICECTNVHLYIGNIHGGINGHYYVF